MNEDFEKALEYFCDTLVSPDHGDPLVCDIHDVFHDINSPHHNCIGCNLAHSINSIEFFLKRVKYYNNEEEVYTDFIIKLYLFVERVFELFKIIELSQEYRKDNFKSFHNIHRWANFIKHPKAFMFCHDPVFHMDIDENNYDIVIDNDFVQKYYGGSKRNLDLYNKLSNKQKVLVKYPSAYNLIVDFSDNVNKILPLIRENSVYKTILDRKSTFENYFEKEDET